MLQKQSKKSCVTFFWEKSVWSQGLAPVLLHYPTDRQFSIGSQTLLWFFKFQNTTFWTLGFLTQVHQHLSMILMALHHPHQRTHHSLLHYGIMNCKNSPWSPCTWMLSLARTPTTSRSRLALGVTGFGKNSFGFTPTIKSQDRFHIMYGLITVSPKMYIFCWAS